MPPATPRSKAVPIFAEAGTSGLERAGGYITADFLSQLQGINGARVYKEMAYNDPTIWAMLFALKMLIRSVKWTVTPVTDGPKDVAAQEFVEEELFQNMSVPFSHVIAEVCTMFIYGYAPLEMVYARREDNALGLKKLVLRSQHSIEQWVWDEEDPSQLLGFWQLDYYTGHRAFIPIGKVLLFRTDPSLQNPEGLSVLRGAYTSWLRKKTIEQAEGRAALRAAGVVVLRIPGDLLAPGLSPEEAGIANAYKAAAQKLAEDRQGAMVLPSDTDPESKEPQYSLEYVVADGRRSGDMTTIIERIDKRIAMTVLADFILLGQQAVGSFALSSDKTALFAHSTGAFLQIISDVFNGDLLPRLWAANQFDPETMPKLVPGDLENRDLASLSGFLSTLVNAGMPLFPDPTLQAYLREQAGLPEADEEKVLEDKLALDEQKLKQQAAAKGPAAGGAAKDRRPFAKANPNHHPAGSPGGIGGQFAPKDAEGVAASTTPHWQLEELKRQQALVEDLRQDRDSAIEDYGNQSQEAAEATDELDEAERFALEIQDDINAGRLARGEQLLRVIPIAAERSGGTFAPREGVLQAVGDNVVFKLRDSNGYPVSQDGPDRVQLDLVFGKLDPTGKGDGEAGVREYVRRMAAVLPRTERPLGVYVRVDARGAPYSTIGVELRGGSYHLWRQFGQVAVKHESFEMEQGLQGLGIGGAVTLASMQAYKEMGLSRVDTYANVDVGGYAWARLGFQVQPSYWHRLKLKVHEEVGKLRQRGALTDGQAQRLRKMLQDEDWLRKIASARIRDGVGRKPLNAGKLLLQGRSYDATFDLKDPKSWATLHKAVGKPVTFPLDVRQARRAALDRG